VFEVGRTRWAAATLALTLALVAPVQATMEPQAQDAPAPATPEEAAQVVVEIASRPLDRFFGLPDLLFPDGGEERRHGHDGTSPSDPSSGSSGPSNPSGGGSSPPQEGKPALVRGTTAKLNAIVHTAEGLVPADAIEGAIGTAQATAERAQRLPGEILGPTEQASGESEPAPAGTAPEAVQPSIAPTLLIAAGAAAAATATFLGFWLAGSSGAVASPAATAAARRLADLRRLLPFASPLFTRFERDTVLGHPRREALYALILQQPGISLQSLGESSGLSRTAVIHHLRLLEQQHLVVSKRVGRSRHYFENGGRYGHDQKDAYAILQNGRSKAVAEFVRHHPGAMQKALCEALGIQPSIAHWHVRRLAEAGIVEAVRRGRTVAYFPGPGLQAMQADPALAAMAASAPPATA
jgi:DNA-binding transcriptional ArsR family regulator